MAYATWTKLVAADSIKRSSQTVSAVDDSAYIFGGELAPRQPVDSNIFAISLKNGSSLLSEVKPVSIVSPQTPQPRVGSAATALKNKIFVFSGRGGTAMAPIEEQGSFWVFDVEARAWSQLKPQDSQIPYPAGRSYHALANDGNDTIFLHAGCPETGRLNDLWAFKLSERRWTQLTAAPGSGRGGTSIAVANGIIFRMNGFDGKTEQGGLMDKFDMSTNTWTSTEYPADGISGPSPRSVACLLPLNIGGKPSLITMFGEGDPSNLGHQGAGKMLGDIWRFDIQTETWTRVNAKVDDDGPSARGWFDADVVRVSTGAAVIVHGGLAASNERLNDLWLLTV